MHKSSSYHHLAAPATLPNRGQTCSSWLRQRNVIASDKPASIRKVTAALNKLTDRNYATLVQTVTSFAPQLSKATLLKLILEQSTKQSCYAHVFVRMAKDLLRSGGGEGESDAATASEVDACRIEIHAFCAEFYHRTFLQKEEYLVSKLCNNNNSNKSAEQYDAFCEHVKSKALLIGKARTILYLLLENLVDGKIIQSFIYNVLEGIAYVRTLDSMSEDKEKSRMTPLALLLHKMPASAHLMDIMLDLALEYRNIVDKVGKDLWDEDVSSQFAHLLEDCEVLKLRFKLMDILRI
jgi:hypothetical protein